MTRYDKTAIALAVIPLLLIPAVLTLLPERIPTHWNIQGQADNWGSPLGLLLFFQVGLLLLLLLYGYQLRALRKLPQFITIGRILMIGIMGYFVLLELSAFGLAWYAQFGPPSPWMTSSVFLGFNLLFLSSLYYYTPRMFPGQPENAAITRKVMMAALLFFTAITLLVLAGISGNLSHLKARSFLLSGMGIFFAVIGNIMPKWKTNPWAGIRVKWTMEDPEIWYKTHRIGGRIWLAGGLLLAALPFIAPLRLVEFALPPLIAILALTPVFYAWRLACRKRKA